MQKDNTIIIIGAGIAGVATAYYLLKNNSNLDVVLIDKNQPLSFTTSKSGENFRDYWPQECMRQLVSDSIILMEELRAKYGSDAFDMVHSGYNFISHDVDNPIFGEDIQEDDLDYMEKITDATTLQNEYSYLDKKVEKIIRIKNAGKIDVYAMGSLLLGEAKKKGLKHLQGEITSITKEEKFEIEIDANQTITADKIVIAAGPFINHIANMLGFQFPILNTLQRKFIMPDPKGVIPKDMPFTIYADAQHLDWSQEEIDFFEADEKYQFLLNQFPGGLHIKPEMEGIKLGWAFSTENVSPTWETPPFELFPQAVIKGASRFIPALSEYENNIPTPLIEYAGYYTRTKENWPLIGPTEIKDVFVIGALAGFGTMAACAAGNLCADYTLGNVDVPNYAKYFHPLRYQDDEMIKKMGELKSDGQL